MKKTIFVILFIIGICPLTVFAEAPVVDYSAPEIKGDVKADSLLVQSEAEEASVPVTTQILSPEVIKTQPKTVTVNDTSSLPLDKRVARLEQQMNNLNQANYQGRIESLQQQLQQLSGDLEVEQHNLKQLQDDMHSLYSDLDQRMGKSKTSDAGTQKVTFFSKPDKAANNAENKSLAQIGVVNGNAKVQTSASRESNNIALQNSSLKEQELYQSAFDLLQAKKYDESAKRLKAYLNAYPDGIYAVNSHYWLGQIYFLEQHYSTSASEFSTIITKYPESSKVPDAMLQLAFIHDKQGKHDQAMKEFAQVKKKFPKSVAARLADQQLKTSVAQ